MAYPYTPKLQFPFKQWRVNSYKFKQPCTYDGVFWGVHLGEDCDMRAGTKVYPIGRGRVVYSALTASQSSPRHGGRRNWGNLIVIAHKNPKTKKTFFSLYGHLGNRMVNKGERVDINKPIGTIAKAWTRANGWWEEAHLHLAITNLYTGKVPVGYFRKDQKYTKPSYWFAPTAFIKKYT
jgi:murein DD-endopeptidase MepM/ murein hydrolase activator NlpD